MAIPKLWKEKFCDKILAQSHLDSGRSSLLSKLLAQRKISVADAESFFWSPLENLSPPESFGPDMLKACDIFCSAAKANYEIAIIGDYDVDGVMSCVILSKLCKKMRVKHQVFLPSRKTEGYGLNPQTVKAFKESWGQKRPGLLIVADSGSSAESAIVDLKTWGINNIIVIDHHLVKKELETVSADAHINWRKQGPCDMSAAGECFHFAKAVCEKNNQGWKEFLAYAAIAAIADVVQLGGDNRIIVKHGLNNVFDSGSMGLSMLAAERGRDAGAILTIEDVMFSLAPKINATGRIDHPSIAFEALIGSDYSTLVDIMAKINDCNTQRKEIQHETEKQAKEIIEKAISVKGCLPNGILLYNKSWPIGICGIACNRLVEKYGIPTLMFGKHNDHIKGSGRSLPGANIYEIMAECSEIFESYGGHELACGAVLKSDKLQDAWKVFDKACSDYYKKHGKPDMTRYYDSWLPANLVTQETGREILATIYPYCSTTNPQPIFLLKDALVEDVYVHDPEDRSWKLTKLSVSKDGKRLPASFKTFRNDLPDVGVGSVIDLFFSFPQSYNVRKGFELELVDIRNKEEIK